MAFFVSFPQNRRIPVLALDEAIVSLEGAAVETFPDSSIVKHEDQSIKLYEFHELPRILKAINGQPRAFNLGQRIELQHLVLTEKMQTTTFLTDPIAQNTEERRLKIYKKQFDDKTLETFMKGTFKFQMKILSKIEKFILNNQKSIEAISQMDSKVLQKQIKLLKDHGGNTIGQIIEELLKLHHRLKFTPEAPVHNLLKTPFESIGDDSL